MMEDELIKIWQSSPKRERIKFDKSRLMLDMQASLNRFDLLAKYGILMEQIGVYIIIPVFSFYIYFVPFWLSKIASFLIVVWGIWYFFQLRRLKKDKPTKMTENYLAYLHRCRDYMAKLKALGDTAMYWYIGPCILGALLFVLGPIIEGVLTGKAMIIILSIIIGTGILAYFYLKWVTRTQYEKRLKKLNHLIKVLEE